jgi:hypothetical protein
MSLSAVGTAQAVRVGMDAFDHVSGPQRGE